MARKHSIAVALALLLVLATAGPALAQGSVTGRIQGAVKDEQGGALPGVTVTAASPALVRGTMTTVTDAGGVYRFPALPPGSYSVSAALSGFKTVQRTNVRVGLGSSIAVDLTLQLESVKTEVVVTGEAPVVSVVQNSVATTFGGDYITKQAVPRNYYQVITTAPGVNADTGTSGSAILAYGGTTESQNAFTLDGVNVADTGSGAHWVLPSIQWMEEIQITGLGANAEYGGYTGGVINGVTKSGGNDFKGALEAYFQPDSFTSDNSPDTEDETFEFEDYALSIGGPVVKDRLWFFASAEYWHQVSTPVGARDTSDREIPRFLGKLTYQLGEKNRFFAMGEYDSVTNERRGIDAYTFPEATQKQDGPGASFSVNWEAILGSTSFVNLKVTGYDGNDDYLPYNGTGTPGHDDEYGLTDYNLVNAKLQNLSHRHLVTGDASWSLFVDGLFGKRDSHSFKFGALYEKASTTDEWRRNGGFSYYDDSTLCPGDTEEEQIASYLADPTCGWYERSTGYGEYEVHAEHEGFTFYAQDSMRLDRVTVNAGLRYTGYRAGWRDGFGNPDVYEVDFVDPRVGFAWDVLGNATLAVKGHWGRYHSSMYTWLYDREISGHASVPDGDCYWDGSEWGGCETSVPDEAPIGDVSHPYVDETLFTVEYQLGKDMAVAADYVNRRFRSLMGLVNTNTAYEPVTGIPNPIEGGDLEVWTLDGDPVWVLTTENPGYRDYDSVVLRFDKRYGDGWQLRSSLVWTDLQGNVLKNNGYAPELEDRNGLVNADGRMDSSFNEWEFKLSGAVDLPFGFVASGQYTYLSGAYWTPYGDVRSFLDGNYYSGRDVFLTERGSQKLDARNIVDVRLAWGTKVAGTTRLELSLECFNLLNTGKTLTVENYYGRYRSSGWTRSASYGEALSIESPRQLRLGARFTF
ncbi:TonB-dependent receptor [Acidobacteria bacterium ACD]|nr:TonB-dependent receptor [Acidobacteria bacterium ACD]